jgi:flagellar FliL protein
MSGQAAESPAASGGGGAGGGGSNKALIIVVLVFNVLIAAGLGYQVLMGQAKGATGQIKAGDEHGKAAAPTKFGPLIEVGSLVANLSGPLSGHYAKVFMHLEASDEKMKTRIEEALVPIRSEALLYLNGLDIKDASGQAQIRTMSEALKTRLNALIGTNTIRRVYFSEFVVQ